MDEVSAKAKALEKSDPTNAIESGVKK